MAVLLSGGKRQPKRASPEGTPFRTVQDQVISLFANHWGYNRTDVREGLKGRGGPARWKVSRPSRRFDTGVAPLHKLRVNVRAKYRSEALRLMVMTDPYSPARFRCNGPLSNLAEFAGAFGIHAGSPMRRPAAGRIEIWRAMKPLMTIPAVLTALALGQPVRAHAGAGLDFFILPSVLYAHDDVWNHTPSLISPVMTTTGEVAPEQRLDLVITAGNFSRDADGRADVAADFTVRYPGGRIQRLPGGFVVAGKTKVADSRTLLLSSQIPVWSADPGAVAGDYRFEITLHDRVGGADATRSVIVRVTDSNRPLSLDGPADLSKWVSGYFEDPKPRLALSELLAFSHTHNPFSKNALPPLYGFFAQVMADNPWLMPQFKEKLATTTSHTERRMLAKVLAYATRSRDDFGDDLPEGARKELAIARGEPMPVPSPEPKFGAQLDVLWGQFFASGRFEPINELATVVKDYLPFRGSLAAYKALETKPPTVPPEVMKDVLLSSALWSLGSNARQHKLVHDYVVYIAEDKDTTPELKVALTAALAWRPRS